MHKLRVLVALIVTFLAGLHSYGIEDSGFKRYSDYWNHYYIELKSVEECQTLDKNYLNHLEDSYQANKQNPDVSIEYGMYLVYTDKNDLAIQVLSPFAENKDLTPIQQANVLVWLAEAALNKGDKAGAIRYLEVLNGRKLNTSARGGPDPAHLAREVLPWLKGLTLDEMQLPKETGAKAFPEPHTSKYTDNFVQLQKVNLSLGSKISEDDARVRLLKTKFARFGIAFQKNAPFTISIDEGTLKAPEKEEGYALSVTKEGAVLQGYDKIGTTWAVVSLIQVIDQSKNAIRICEINDWPVTPQRGALMSDSRSMEVALFSKTSMVSDQGALTQNWGETPLRFFTVLEPSRRYAEFGISFYAGDRSLTMYPKYPLTSERTFELHKKVFSQIAEAGGNVLFLYDDVRYPLHEQDLKLKKNSAALDAQYVTRLFREIRKTAPTFRMIFCPPFYWGPYYAGIFKSMEKNHNESWTDYNRSLKEELDFDIDIFWSGIRLVSQDITKSDTDWAEEAFNRKPSLWQNRPFPHAYHFGAVVDAIPWAKMHEPGIGLRGAAYNQTTPHSAIPIAAWNEALWNPTGSDARESVRRASETFCGKGFFEALEPGSKAFYEIDSYTREGQLTPYILRNVDKFEASVTIARDAYARAMKEFPESQLFDCGGYGFATTLHHTENILRQAKTAQPDYFHKRFASKLEVSRELAKTETRFDDTKGDILKLLPDIDGGEIADYHNKRPNDPSSLLIRGVQLDQTRVNWLEIPFETDKPAAYEMLIGGQIEEHRGPVTWRIMLNGKLIYEGETGLKEFERSVTAYKLPVDAMAKNNIVRIESTTPGGTPWNGPWLMINYIVFKKQ
ncbi:MAG: hypothetical protein GX811_08885 [Lentisphaerae bacterium]|nr:hypothetical protein [Lentisphaerota bacterium]